MKDVIFWFSGTGNTRSVAAKVAGSLGGARYLAMVAATGREAAGAETVGIAFPVYYFGLPLYVLDFLLRLEVSKDAYVYTVATMAGSPGIAHGEAATILDQRGIRLAAGWSVKMPGNYTPLYGAPSPRAQGKCFTAAAAKATRIAAAVMARQAVPLEDSLLPLRVVSPLLRRVAKWRIPSRDQAFRVAEHCTSCGTCEQVCPTQNLKIVDGHPVWGGHCEECMACLQWCPVEAIDAGWVTRGRKRYRHPDFKAEDFMLHRETE